MEIIGIVIDWKVAANSHFYRFPSVQSLFAGYFDARVIKSRKGTEKVFSSFLRNVTWLSFDLTFEGSEIGDKKSIRGELIVVEDERETFFPARATSKKRWIGLWDRQFWFEEEKKMNLSIKIFSSSMTRWTFARENLFYIFRLISRRAFKAKSDT